MPDNPRGETAIKPYTIQYKYKRPEDKAAGNGAIKFFRIYATSMEEARRIVQQQARYPYITVLNIKEG